MQLAFALALTGLSAPPRYEPRLHNAMRHVAPVSRCISVFSSMLHFEMLRPFPTPRLHRGKPAGADVGLKLCIPGGVWTQPLSWHGNGCVHGGVLAPLRARTHATCTHRLLRHHLRYTSAQENKRPSINVEPIASNNAYVICKLHIYF